MAAAPGCPINVIGIGLDIGIIVVGQGNIWLHRMGLLRRQDDFDIAAFDTTELHARAAMDFTPVLALIDAHLQ